MFDHLNNILYLDFEWDFEQLNYCLFIPQPFRVKYPKVKNLAYSVFLVFILNNSDTLRQIHFFLNTSFFYVVSSNCKMKNFLFFLFYHYKNRKRSFDIVNSILQSLMVYHIVQTRFYCYLKLNIKTNNSLINLYSFPSKNKTGICKTNQLCLKLQWTKNDSRWYSVWIIKSKR